MNLRKIMSMCCTTILCLGILTSCSGQGGLSGGGDKTYAQLEYPEIKRTYTVEELIVDWSKEYEFRPYSEDVFLMYKDELYGFYDITTHEILSECIYTLSSYTAIDGSTWGGYLSDEGYMLAYRDDGNTFVLLDDHGHELFSVENGSANYAPSEGLIVVSTPRPDPTPNGDNKLRSVYTVDGELIVPPTTAIISPCVGGFMAARDYEQEPERQCYFINAKGEITDYVQDGEFLRTRTCVLSEGLIPVKYKTGIGYADATGQMVISGVYDAIYGGFSNGRASVESEGVFGIIDTKGNELTPFMYSSVEMCSNGLIIVSADDLTYGMIDLDGNEILPSVYVSIDVSDTGIIQGNYSDQDISETQIPGAEPIPNADFFFYSNGTLTQYDYIEEFSEGFARVVNDSLYGFIGLDGTELVAPTYHFAEPFAEGFAQVSDGPAVPSGGYIDTTGELVIPCIYFPTNDFKDGLAKVGTDDNRYLFIDTQGNAVYEFDQEANPAVSSWEAGTQQNGLIPMRHTSDDGNSGFCMTDIYGNIAIDEKVNFCTDCSEMGFIAYNGKLVLIHNPLVLE